MRRSIAVVAVSLVFAALPASAAFADNPHTIPGSTGQPGQSCEDLGVDHAGFDSGGFLHAKTVYANVPESGQGAETNSHAVSQYDVACFQQFNH
jgi:hypothetical protein